MRHTTSMIVNMMIVIMYPSRCTPNPRDSSTTRNCSLSMNADRYRSASINRRPTMSVQDSNLSHMNRGINDGINHRLELHSLSKYYRGDIDSRGIAPPSSAVDLELADLNVVDVP